MYLCCRGKSHTQIYHLDGAYTTGNKHYMVVLGGYLLWWDSQHIHVVQKHCLCVFVVSQLLQGTYCCLRPLVGGPISAMVVWSSVWWVGLWYNLHSDNVLLLGLSTFSTLVWGGGGGQVCHDYAQHVLQELQE